MSWNRGWLIKSSVLIWKGVSATLQSGRYTFSCPRGHTMQGYYSQMRACDRIVKFWFWMKSWDDGVRDKHLWWTVTQTMVYSDCDVTVTALFRLWRHSGCPIQTVTSQWLPYSDCDVTHTQNKIITIDKRGFISIEKQTAANKHQIGDSAILKRCFWSPSQR